MRDWLHTLGTAAVLVLVVGGILLALIAATWPLWAALAAIKWLFS